MREKRTWSKNLQEEDLAKESEKEYLETEDPEGAAHAPSQPHSEVQTSTPTITIIHYAPPHVTGEHIVNIDWETSAETNAHGQQFLFWLARNKFCY